NFWSRACPGAAWPSSIKGTFFGRTRTRNTLATCSPGGAAALKPRAGETTISANRLAKPPFGSDQYQSMMDVPGCAPQLWETTAVMKTVERDPEQEIRRLRERVDELTAALERERAERRIDFDFIVNSIPAQVAVTAPNTDVETLNQSTLDYFG